ncbi:transcriptional regulator, RpiR family [Tistlia consotensis]|uniref:Transcriptional regulator, RpiR family n=1 Tax=Tistlia consotensis USBA 355 TaxID=560819 RepID=A0A1Y6C4W4_9PROT|nr:MurR/RpiR family transcriptional regulator [Tistlia consotensis]SMF45623.1 transcriptional regulator, RpiR family [Tistlia consotensis USBA 355]SNR79585.1 transcriptional regulator, RpiR family [Tistlia consotensis]
MESSIATRVRNQLGRLTPTERRPALILLDNYPVAGLETVAQFARRAGVSGPTVLRLVAKLGFESYLDFQQALRDELERRLQTPLAKAPEKAVAAGEDGQGAGDFLAAYGRSIVENVERSLAELSREEFEGAVELLADERRKVLLLGGRFTASQALHLYQHLRELRPGVALVEGQTATWVEHLLDVGRRDVLVVYDIRRYQDDVVRFARAAAGLGAQVVLITDHWVSPLAAVARHVFPVRTVMPSSWESFSAISAVNEALIARVHERRWGPIKKRMERLEALRGQLAGE